MMQIIDADFTMLNARLAKHYGMEGPKSQKFERTSLKGTNRPGGILGTPRFICRGPTERNPIRSDGRFGSGNDSCMTRPNHLRRTYPESKRA